MKKYLNNFIFILILIAFSCEDVKESNVISSVPSSFTKKVLIEEFTGDSKRWIKDLSTWKDVKNG